MKKKKILLGAGLLVLIILNVLILSHSVEPSGSYNMTLELSAKHEQEIQVFFGIDKNISEENSQILFYEDKGEKQTLNFQIPSGTEAIRLDLGKTPDQFEISQCMFSYNKEEADPDILAGKNIEDSQQISKISGDKSGLHLTTTGDDPFLWIAFPEEELYPVMAKDVKMKNVLLNILMALLIDGATLIAVWKHSKFLTLPIELYENRALIWDLSKNDFKTKYAGSYLGIVWAFIQPIVTILVYWFVFTVGLKAGSMSDYPFVIYLVSGMVPWFFFQDALNSGTNALMEYNYLVKKVVFKISILPIVKIISALFVHLFFVAFALILCACYGYLPGLHTLQILYYSACTFIFTLGCVYATSAIVIFFRDLVQIISIFLQVGVWLTPIMWDLQMLANHPLMMKLFKLNPLYYIVSGYRDAMLSKVWFWDHWGWTFYFWVVTAAMFVIGAVVFKRLKPHFADVL